MPLIFLISKCLNIPLSLINKEVDKMAKDMDMKSWCKGKGVMMLIVGLLVLANTYWAIVSWDYFIGIILVLAGIIKLLK